MSLRLQSAKNDESVSAAFFSGQWTFTFDPLFETQRIHWVRIIRDGEIIANFDPLLLEIPLFSNTLHLF